MARHKKVSLEGLKGEVEKLKEQKVNLEEKILKIDRLIVEKAEVIERMEMEKMLTNYIELEKYMGENNLNLDEVISILKEKKSSDSMYNNDPNIFIDRAIQ